MSQIDKKIDDLVASTMILSQNCPAGSIRAATQNDKIFQTFCEPPMLSISDAEEGIGWLINSKMDAIFGVDKIDTELFTGPFGIELMLKWISRARIHETWKKDTNGQMLLKLKLERICDVLKGEQSLLSLVVQSLTCCLLSVSAAGATPYKTKPKTMLGDGSVAKPPVVAGQKRRVLSDLTTESPNNTKKTKQHDAKPARRKGYDLAFKSEVIAWHNSHGRKIQRETARHFNIQQSLISRWLRDEEKICENATMNGGGIRKQRMAKYPHLEVALYHWVIEARERDLPVNDEILRKKAQHFASILQIEMKCSDGWLTKFKKRYNLRKVTLHGEASSVNPEDVESARAEILEETKKYQPCNIYNGDETGLCYRYVCSFNPMLTVYNLATQLMLSP